MSSSRTWIRHLQYRRVGWILNLLLSLPSDDTLCIVLRYFWTIGVNSNHLGEFMLFLHLPISGCIPRLCLWWCPWYVGLSTPGDDDVGEDDDDGDNSYYDGGDDGDENLVEREDNKNEIAIEAKVGKLKNTNLRFFLSSDSYCHPNLAAGEVWDSHSAFQHFDSDDYYH